MLKAYSHFLERIGKLLDILKKNIVVSHLFLKVFYLLVLFVVKFFFICVALPYYLFAKVDQPIKNLTKNSLEKFTVSHLRLQKIVVLSSLVILALGTGFHFLFSSFSFQGNTLHGVANAPLQFSGSRNIEETVPHAINTIDVSPVDFIVTFKGTGPSYSHVTVFIDDGETFVGISKVNSQGEWQLTKTASEGILEPGDHSAFAIFYSDDNTVLGRQTPAKSFHISPQFFDRIIRHLGTNTFYFFILAVGIFWFSIVKLRKTVQT
jgi:hypothetical protein